MTYIIRQEYRSTGLNQRSAIDDYRDEVLAATLRAYSPDIAPQHQCITNQVAEDLLE